METKRTDRAAFAVGQWKHEKPDWDFLPMELIGRIGEAMQVIRNDHIEPLFAQYGLQTGAFDVLATLRRAGRNEKGLYALTPSQMYDSTMVSSGGMTNRLDRLEKKGLIARHPNPNDRRGTLVALTDEGLALVEKVLEAHLENETRIVAPLTRGEQEQLSVLLGKLLAGVDQLDKPKKI